MTGLVNVCSGGQLICSLSETSEFAHSDQLHLVTHSKCCEQCRTFLGRLEMCLNDPVHLNT